MAKTRHKHIYGVEKYCLLCGGHLALVKLEGKYRPRCRRCGWVYFKNPASASAVAIISDSSVVLVKRKLPPHAGTWGLPAGFQEYDERPEEAAIRETKEETNLDIQLKGLYRVHFNDSIPGLHTVVHVYLAERVGGRMRPGDDAVEVREFSLRRLPRKIGFKSHLRVLRELLTGNTSPILPAGKTRKRPCEKT